MADCLRQESMEIRTEGDIALVPRRVRELAQRNGFDTFATAAIVTACSELARNALVHGGGGVAQIQEITDGDEERVGIRIHFRDQGPGIPDIARVLVGGFSTMRSLGLGLSGSKRLVDEFKITSLVGKGTEITITKWPRY